MFVKILKILSFHSHKYNTYRYSDTAKIKYWSVASNFEISKTQYDLYAKYRFNLDKLIYKYHEKYYKNYSVV